jgi:hypothetical protein
VARREEWQEQETRSPAEHTARSCCAFWIATDPVAPSVTSGAMRKGRGVKPGVPDVLVWYREIHRSAEIRRGAW